MSHTARLQDRASRPSCDRPPSRAALARLLTAVLLLGLGACATPGGSADDEGTRQRAERVFRMQNQVTTRAMFAQMDPGTRDAQELERLYEAEAAVREACEPLNRVALSYVDAHEPTLAEKLRVPASLAPCERETQRLDGLLHAYGL